MSRSTRSSKIDAGTVKTILGLTDAEIAKLRDDYTLTEVEHLALLDKVDVDEIFGNDPVTFMKRRKLWALVQFLRAGGTLTPSTSVAEMHELVANPTPRRLPSTSTPASRASSPAPAPAPIRLSSADFPTFSGDIDDQEKYITKAEAKIGQTAFRFLLSRDATTDDEKERDEELFNVFKESFVDGTAYHLISRSLQDPAGNPLPPSGRRFWTQFHTWCNSGGRKNTVIKKCEKGVKGIETRW